MNVRFQKTARGEVAVLPRADYEALVAKAAEADEDAGTARLVARARKEINAGAPLIPKVVADRLAAGENPLRVLRQWREISQVELCTAVGIGQGYLSDLEAGRRKGPVELHAKLARALDAPVDLLLGIAVSLREATPKRAARQSRIVGEMQRSRRAPRGLK